MIDVAMEGAGGDARVSHYFDASLPQQFDAVLHVDATTALEPLDDVSGWRRSDAPETYPHAV